jgi:hypothetical protein
MFFDQQLYTTRAETTATVIDKERCGFLQR